MKRISALILIAIAIGAFSVPASATDTLTVATIARTGTTFALVAAADDTLYIPNNGRTWVHIADAGAQITATFVSYASNYTNIPEGMTATNLSVTIPASTGNKIIGPFNQRSWNNASDYLVLILSSITSITVAAYSLP
jgi:hypothetical protein